MLERVLTGLVVVPFLLGAAAAPVAHEHVLFHYVDPDVVEASALVVTDGLFVTTNDSGDTGRIFAADPATGRTVGVTHWSTDPVDTEALAPDGPGRVWVGDIGDNDSVRSSITLAEVPIGRGTRTVRPTIYRLRYPDGAHNAETLMRDPVTGRLYIATKGLLGGTLYAVPTPLSATTVNVLTPIGDVLPIATDGAFFPDGKHLVVRNYGAATVYAWPSLARVATFDLPAQPQGEGIAVHAGALYLGSEGRDSAVLEYSLPAAVARIVEPAPVASSVPAPAASSRPGPSSSITDPPAVTVSDASPWPWVFGGAVGLAIIAVLIRSMKPR